MKTRAASKGLRAKSGREEEADVEQRQRPRRSSRKRDYAEVEEEEEQQQQQQQEEEEEEQQEEEEEVDQVRVMAQATLRVTVPVALPTQRLPSLRQWRQLNAGTVKSQLAAIHAWRFVDAAEEPSDSQQLHQRRHRTAHADSDRKEFFVTFEGRSHRFDQWISYERLLELGGRKTRNFLDKDLPPLQPHEPPVPVEWTQCARVLDAADGNLLCLWTGLDYSDATWEEKASALEDPFIKRQYELYLERVRAKPKPRIPRKLGKEFVPLTGDEIGLGINLFPHQVEGINWLFYSWLQGRNCVLADEMGLGKTCQTIGVFKLLNRMFNRSRFIVLCPLTTVPNWKREFERFLPDMDVIALSGSEDARDTCFSYDIEPGRFQVLLASFEMVMVDSTRLSKIQWDALVVDEGHRAKNAESKFARCARQLECEWKVVLTGTPVQNNTMELVNLLYFLDVEEMSDRKKAAEEFSEKNLKDPATLSKLHAILRNYMLRRVKKDVDLHIPGKVEIVVPVSLSMVQRVQYKQLLAHNFSHLARTDSTYKRKMPLLNVFAQLRKCCQHPYLFPEAEPVLGDVSEDVVYERLIESSGKLALLDKMLHKLREQGHRVLIFSQFVIMLDILEDYLNYRKFPFERIDGMTSMANRQAAIDRFNSPKSSSFCFLMSTRASRLGINLATADTVIIYDADFNPQNDLQALARAHRIGQKNLVMVYTLVVRNSIEERLLELARQKMLLDHLVVESMLEEQIEAPVLNDLLLETSQKLFGEDQKEQEIVFTDAALDELLRREGREEEQERQLQQQKEEKELQRQQRADGGAAAAAQGVVEEPKEGEMAAGLDRKKSSGLGSFKFARVWEAQTNNDPSEPIVSSATSFWSKLLAAELQKIQDEERAKADMYGKGKRRRSTVRRLGSFASNAVDGSPSSRDPDFQENSDDDHDDDDDDSDVNIDLEDLEKERRRLFSTWVHEYHRRYSSQAKTIWKQLKESEKIYDWTRPFVPAPPRTPLEFFLADVGSQSVGPDSMASLPLSKQREYEDMAASDKYRYDKEVSMCMPLSMIKHVQRYLDQQRIAKMKQAMSTPVAVKKPDQEMSDMLKNLHRSASAQQVADAADIGTDAAVAAAPETFQRGTKEKATRKQCFVKWLERCYPHLAKVSAQIYRCISTEDKNRFSFDQVGRMFKRRARGGVEFYQEANRDRLSQQVARPEGVKVNVAHEIKMLAKEEYAKLPFEERYPFELRSREEKLTIIAEMRVNMPFAVVTTLRNMGFETPDFEAAKAQAKKDNVLYEALPKYVEGEGDLAEFAQNMMAAALAQPDPIAPVEAARPPLSSNKSKMAAPSPAAFRASADGFDEPVTPRAFSMSADTRKAMQKVMSAKKRDREQDGEGAGFSSPGDTKKTAINLDDEHGSRGSNSNRARKSGDKDEDDDDDSAEFRNQEKEKERAYEALVRELDASEQRSFQSFRKANFATMVKSFPHMSVVKRNLALFRAWRNMQAGKVVQSPKSKDSARKENVGNKRDFIELE